MKNLVWNSLPEKLGDNTWSLIIPKCEKRSQVDGCPVLQLPQTPKWGIRDGLGVLLFYFLYFHLFYLECVSLIDLASQHQPSFLLSYCFIGIQLRYDIVLVSDVQQWFDKYILPYFLTTPQLEKYFLHIIYSCPPATEATGRLLSAHGYSQVHDLG